MTKEQILQALSVLDLPKLERLHKYSQLLIIPEEDLLVNVTAEQMLQKIFDLADKHFPEWTDRTEADFGRFLAELICLFSEKDFWYINAFANEAILRKTKEYSIAFTKAVSFGYDPTLCHGAAATFDVAFAAGAETTYKRGELIVRVPNSDIQYSNDQDFTVPANGSAMIVPLVLREGKQVIENVIFNGHAIYGLKPMVDIESIGLVINGTEWTRVRSFGHSGNASTHYIVVPEADGKFTVYFGEDGYGVKPDIGQTMVLYYRTTKGTEGNIPIQTVQVSKSLSSRSALSATMTTAATGGTLPEPLESLKNNAVLFFSSKKAAVNPDVTEAILKTYPEVHNAKVTVLGNNVYFRVIPKDGTVASVSLLNTLQSRLEPHLMLGYFCVPQETEYVECGPLTMEVFLLKGYSVPETESRVKQLVEDYTNPLVLAGYGDSFDLTELNILCKSQVPGVQNVTFSVVAGGTAASVLVDAIKIKKKINQANITITTHVIQ